MSPTASGPTPAPSPPGPSPGPPTGGAPSNLREAYAELGAPSDLRPGHVVHRHGSHVMFNLGTVDPDFRPQALGLWVSGGEVRVLTQTGQIHPEKGPAETYGLSGGSLVLIDTLVYIGRNALARLEDLDAAVAALEEKALEVDPKDVIRQKRRVALVRSELSRVITAVTELQGGRIGSELPGIAGALSTVEVELLRLRDATQSTQTALTDLLAIRQVAQSNSLEVIALQLQSTSNRIANLSNISNIRMLALAYMALVIALLGILNIFPTTFATIFGMPSAGWVSGDVVTAVIVLSMVIPLGWLLSQRWLRDALRGMSHYEGRIDEGMSGLMENIPDPRSAERITRDPPTV